MQQQEYILGLDIGIASAAAVLLGENRIIDIFVRTFEKAETADRGESLNKVRREAGVVRRRLRRRASRLSNLRRLMVDAGLIDSPSPGEFQKLPKEAGPEIPKELWSPWELRAEGLDRKLEPKEWASILYHIVKRRGFHSNRKSETISGEETEKTVGEMLAGIQSSQLVIKQYRTIGEAFDKDPLFQGAKRNKDGEYKRTVSRIDLEAELRKLFDVQRSLGNPHADEAFEDAVHELLMQRRPALSGNALLAMVGNCTFETDEKRAPKASFLAERFVWLTKLNNLRIFQNGRIRPLDDQERNKIIELPFTQARLTYQQVRRILDLDVHATFSGVQYNNKKAKKSANPEDATFFEATAFHRIRRAYETSELGERWNQDRHNAALLDDIAFAMTCFKEDSESKEYLQKKGVNEAVIDAVLSVSFEKFISLSQRALQKIVPFMEQGKRYDEAVIEAGYEHHSQFKKQITTGYIPKPDKDVIRNPVVFRAINQCRKLVNAIVKKYGPPKEIRIELSRDLSRAKDERDDITRKQKAFQVEKESVRKRFEETHGRKLNNKDLLKARFYEEQDCKCAYSLKPIVVNRLFEPGYVEIDHVLPLSRSFDDSMNNKVLVLISENQNKGNRTPFEYLGGKNDSDQWRDFHSWVSTNKKLRRAKQNRLLRTEFINSANEFRARHLNDTRYIAREFKQMLETYLRWSDSTDKQDRCVVVNGQIISLLRARWGLLKVREEGDLHHALDAAVVAACNRSFIKRMTEYSKRKELAMVKSGYVDPETGEVINPTALEMLKEQFPVPYPSFREELLARLSPDPGVHKSMPGYTNEEWQAVKPIRVSRPPSRRGLGEAHEATIRSIGRGGKLLEEGKSSKKTSLRDLTKASIENIVGKDRDKVLFSAISERMKKHGYDAKKAFATPLYKTLTGEPDAEGRAPLIRSVKVLNPSQKSGILVRGGIADNGSMIRLDIFTKANRFFAVPIYASDVAKGALPNRAVVSGKPESEWLVLDDSYTFLFTLHPNDWLRVQRKHDVVEGYYSGFDRWTGAVHIRAHDRNPRFGKDGLRRGIGIRTVDVLAKFHVDIFGNLHPARNEVRAPLQRPKGKDRR